MLPVTLPSASVYPSVENRLEAAEQLRRTDVEQLHYKSNILQVGTFHCPPTYPLFHTAGKIHGYVLAFPRTSVYIQYAQHKQPIVADPNVVMLYNPGQDYERKQLSELGDISDWFAFKPQVVREVIKPYDPYVAEREKELFLFSHGPSTAEVYFLHRLVQQMARLPQRDTLFIEETLQNVLERIVAFTYQVHGERREPARPSTARQHRELADATKALIAQQYAADLSLDEIAQTLYTSTYHLCRVFRQQTGQTIHNYRNQMRLRVSLDIVAATTFHLTDIALSLGYANHSHFTTTFRNTFGISPSTWRETASLKQLREMGQIVSS